MNKKIKFRQLLM